MKSQTHIGFWLAMIIVLLIVVPLFVSAQSQYIRLTSETDAISRVFGTKTAGRIVDAATSTHDSIVRGTGLQALLDRGMHTAREKRDAVAMLSFVGKGLSEGGNRYVASLTMQLYGVVLRCCVVVFWLLVLAPFIAAALVDGFAIRAVKMAGFGYTNPTGFALGMHALVLVSVFPLLYIVTPLGISPLFMPIWALVGVGPTLLALAHTQRVFGN